MIQAIIFDCFGVLTTDFWLAFCDSLPESADLAQASALNKAFDRGIISRQEYAEGVKLATGQLPPILEDVRSGEITKNQALINLIRQLKPDYKTGILSNINSQWITDDLLSADEQELFDAMVLSYQVGLIKPDPRAFILTCERLRVSTGEALMVDDRPLNVEAARAAGLTAILYEDMRSFKQQLNELLNTDY